MLGGTAFKIVAVEASLMGRVSCSDSPTAKARIISGVESVLYPLWITALWKRPLALGARRRVRTFNAPADSPI